MNTVFPIMEILRHKEEFGGESEGTINYMLKSYVSDTSMSWGKVLLIIAIVIILLVLVVILMKKLKRSKTAPAQPASTNSAKMGAAAKHMDLF